MNNLLNDPIKTLTLDVLVTEGAPTHVPQLDAPSTRTINKNAAEKRKRGEEEERKRRKGDTACEYTRVYRTLFYALKRTQHTTHSTPTAAQRRAHSTPTTK
jgi:hypothetical protein